MSVPASSALTQEEIVARRRAIPYSAGVIAYREASGRRTIANQITSTFQLQALIREQVDEGLALLSDTVKLIPAQLAKLHDVVVGGGNLANVVPLPPPNPAPQGYINQSLVVPLIVTTLTALDANHFLLVQRGGMNYGMQYLLSKHFGYSCVQPVDPYGNYAAKEEHDSMVALNSFRFVLKKPFEMIMRILMRGMPRMPEDHTATQEYTMDVMLPLVEQLIRQAEETPTIDDKNKFVVAADALFCNGVFSGTDDLSVLAMLLHRCPTDRWKAMWTDHFEVMRLFVMCIRKNDWPLEATLLDRLAPYQFWELVCMAIHMTAMHSDVYTRIIVRADTRKYYRVPRHADNHLADNIHVLFNLDPPKVRGMFMWKRFLADDDAQLMLGTDVTNNGVDYDEIKTWLIAPWFLDAETRILKIIGTELRRLLEDVFVSDPVTHEWAVTVAGGLYATASYPVVWNTLENGMAALTALDVFTRTLYGDSNQSSLLKPGAEAPAFETQMFMSDSSLLHLFAVIERANAFGNLTDQLRDELCAHVWKCITGFMHLAVPAMRFKAEQPENRQMTDVLDKYLETMHYYTSNATIKEMTRPSNLPTNKSLEVVDDFIQRLLLDTTKCPVNDMSVVFLRGIQLAISRYSLAIAAAEIRDMHNELRADIRNDVYEVQPRPARPLPWFLARTNRLLTRPWDSESAMDESESAASAANASPPYLPLELQAKVTSYLVATDNDNRIEKDITNMLRSLSIQDAIAMAPAQLVATYIKEQHRIIVKQAVYEVVACMLLTHPEELYIGVEWKEWIGRRARAFFTHGEDTDMQVEPTMEFKIKNVIDFLMSLNAKHDRVPFTTHAKVSVLNECPDLVHYQLRLFWFTHVLSFITEYARRLVAVPILTPTQFLPSSSGPNVPMFPATMQKDVIAEQLRNRLVRMRRPASSSSINKRPLEAASSSSSSKAQRTEAGTRSEVHLFMSPYERALASVNKVDPGFLHLKAGLTRYLYYYMAEDTNILYTSRGSANAGGTGEARALQRWEPIYEMRKNDPSFQQARTVQEGVLGRSLSVIESVMLAVDISEPRTERGSYRMWLHPYPIPLEYENQARINKPKRLANKVLFAISVPANCIVFPFPDNRKGMPTWEEWKEAWRRDIEKDPTSNSFDDLPMTQVFVPEAVLRLTPQTKLRLSDAENQALQNNWNSNPADNTSTV